MALAARGPATAPVTVDEAAKATMTRRLTADTISSANRAKPPRLFFFSSSEFMCRSLVGIAHSHQKAAIGAE
jgi:hypothetical protein